MTPSLFSFGRRRRQADTSAVQPEGVTSREDSWAASDESPSQAPSPSSPPSVTSAPELPVKRGRHAYDPDEVVPGPDPKRNEILEAALENWRDELIDLGGVASLDDVSALDGVVNLTAAHPSGLAQLYAGRPTHLSSLVRERSAQAVARQALREVAGRTDLLARQFGVAPVYLALGVASWDEATPVPDDDAASQPDSSPEEGAAQGEAPGENQTDGVDNQEMATRRINAPVLLRPVRLSSTNGDATITLGASIEVNPVVTRALREAGCEADVEAIARASLSPAGFTPRAALTRLGSLGRQHLRAFSIREQLVVGAFVHPGQALVEDFDATIERARASALVAAIAGDEKARAVLSIELPEADLSDRDPSHERGVGDLDTAQLRAIEAVSSGASLLLDAPPGSDVAATLAAVVADAAASGRTVLHVPATSGDGHAVADALREQGLGDLVVDLTEDPAWRLHAADAIKTSLGVEPAPLDVSAIVAMRQRLAAVRERLAAAIDALHQSREPWNVSAYEALQHLAEFTSGRARQYTSTRISSQRLSKLDEQGREQALSLLHRAWELDLLNPTRQESAWSGITLRDIDQATDVLARLTYLADDVLPTIVEDAACTAEQAGLERAHTLTQWWQQLQMLEGIRESLDIFRPEVFERSAADMVIATASRQWREEQRVEMSGSTRRRFTKLARDLVRPGRAVGDLHAELVKVQHRREAWRRFNPEGPWPQLPAGLDEMKDTAARAREAIEEIQPLLTVAPDDVALTDIALPALLDRTRALADDHATAEKLPEANRVAGQLADLGLADFVADLAARGVGEDEIEAELMYCWWASLLATLLRSDPHLAGLDAGVLGELAGELRELDAAQAQSLSEPVAQAYAQRVRASVEADKDTARALYVALSRDDGVPLRDIIAQYPLAMVAKPIWIVPPTLVPQVFAPQALVDVAVLDASAHMPVAQVLPAFVRAEQVLVVGDPRREVSGVASELGALLPRVTLPTTRNSLDAPIASFLATHGYDGVVEAIPSPPGGARLSLDVVDGRGMPAPGQTAVESVPAEVDRVVDLVIEHALTRPEKSLAVVALNARHAAEVRRATTAAVAGSPALEAFFAAGIAEPFVVVDLSEARSLRRDHIILSVGYAKTPHGRTIHSFGAISQASGLVSLVEALCASRGATQVVSCLAPEDIDPERLHAPGAKLLREVLVRAAGGDEDPLGGMSEQPDRLLVDLAERLWRKGLTVIPRYGLPGGMRIPIAIGHPDYPDELFVAVLTDDSDYVAQKSLRRRDRHWVERLEQRGWRVYQAFSVSVFVDPEAEAAAIENIVLDILTERAQAHPDAVACVPIPDAVASPEEGGSPELGTGEEDGSGPGAHATAGAASSAHAGQGEDAGQAQEDAGREAGVAQAASPEEAAAGNDTGAGPDTGGYGHSVAGGGTATTERAPRPPIAAGLPIQAYSDDQLDDLVAWIRSDGVARSVKDEVEQLRDTLALQRRGSSIEAVLTHAVMRTRLDRGRPMNSPKGL